MLAAMTLDGVPGTKLHERVVAVQLSCSFSWGHVTDSEISDEINTAKHSRKALRVRKSLMPEGSGARVDKLRSALTDFYTWHVGSTLSTPTRGHRLLPVAFHFAYMEKFGDAKAAAEDALLDLQAHYVDDVEAARQFLGTAFKPEDYPSVTEITRYFNMDVKFFPLPTGDRILNILGKEVAAEVDAYVDSMAQAAVNDAKGKLKEVVERMAERLATPNAVFRDSLTANMDDLLGMLPALNVTDDKEFAAIIKDCKQTLQGWDPQQLRKSPVVRSQVAKAAQDILKKLGGAS